MNYCLSLWLQLRKLAGVREIKWIRIMRASCWEPISVKQTIWKIELPRRGRGSMNERKKKLVKRKWARIEKSERNETFKRETKSENYWRSELNIV